ncbi:UDP-glucose 4-epimerase GalE [Candidatus Shapirobacteria bacterium]|nr:UDP-glucose 4-epimerase GalE [Candidatus Shapirobacteria bacterium]
MDKQKILVTGGAGYIGSFIVRALLKSGFKPIIFDSLENGHKESVPPEVELGVGNLQCDTQILDKIFKKEKPQGVIHFAGYIEAGESMKDPQKFFFNNVLGTLNLLKIMMENKIFKLVFSSSAAVYGEPQKIPIDEEDLKVPVNNYGETKLMVEKILQWYTKAYDFNSIGLRYFNACGAALDGSVGEDHDPETHLIPLAIQTALGQRKEFTIFGNDYPTPDGSCIRDYIHVLDLAQAHVAALESLLGKKSGFRAYNVGTGEGYSVLEVVQMVKKVSGIDFASPIGPRRPGDPARLIAKADKIKKELNWQPKYSDLKTIVESAWKWHQSHPKGFAP